MKFVMTVRDKKTKQTWDEDYEKDVSTNEEAEACAQGIIDFWNSTLRPGDNKRELVKVVCDETTAGDQRHDWTKTNLVTIIKSGRSWDECKCVMCGVTGKRYGLGPDVQLDRKFKAKVYQYCNTAQEHLEKRRAKERGIPEFEGCNHWGGDLKELVQPIVRGFDTTRRKRKVTVRIHTWKGTAAVGAKHYYAHLEEEDNPALMNYEEPSGKKSLIWGRAWKDEEGKGREVRLEALTREDVERLAASNFEDEFGSKTHRLVSCMTGEPWRPGQEED